MSAMPTETRRLWSAAATALAVVVLAPVLLAGCTRPDSPRARPTAGGQTGTISVPPGSPSPLPVAATATPVKGQQVTAEINDVRADGEGLAVLRFTLTNTGTHPFELDRTLADPNRDPAVGYDFFSCAMAASGVILADPEGGERYHPLYRSDGDSRYCMNARWGGQRAGTAVEPGHDLVLFATYVLPDDVRAVTVEIPGFGPVPDVPVTPRP